MTRPVEQLEELTAYLDGELDEDARQRVDALLERDAAARALLEQLRQTSRLVGALPRADAPGDLAAAVTARIERRELLGNGGEPWNATPRRAVRWGRRLSAAAAIALVCTAGWLGWQRSSRVVVVPELVGHTDEARRLVAKRPKLEDPAILRDGDHREKTLSRKTETDADGLLDAANSASAVADNAVPCVAMAKTANRRLASTEQPPVPGEAPAGDWDEEADRSAGIASAGRSRGVATAPPEAAHWIEIVSESYETRTAVARAIRRYAEIHGQAVRLREADRVVGVAGCVTRMRWLKPEETGHSETVLVVDLPRSQADDLLHAMSSAASEATGDIHVVANGRQLASIAEAGPWIMGGSLPLQVPSPEPRMATSRAVGIRGDRAVLRAGRKTQARSPMSPEPVATSRAAVAADTNEGPTRISAGQAARKLEADVITLALVLRSPPSTSQRSPPPRKTSPASRPTAVPTSAPADNAPAPARQDGSRG